MVVEMAFFIFAAAIMLAALPSIGGQMHGQLLAQVRGRKEHYGKDPGFAEGDDCHAGLSLGRRKLYVVGLKMRLLVHCLHRLSSVTPLSLRRWRG
ncbi:MAG: hypothetical protein ABIS51_21515 [Sphingomonas sp.]